MPCASRKSRSVEPPSSTARPASSRTAAASALAARPADAVAARARIDAGQEQRLAGIDVARAHDDVARQQRLLDRDAAPPQRRRAGARRSKASSKGSTPRPAEQLAASGVGCVSATRPRRRSGADRSGAACRGVVTRSKWSCAPGAGDARVEAQDARHAQVQQQPAAHRAATTGTCRAARRRRRAPDERLRLAAERPAQRLAEAHRGDARAARCGRAKLRRVTSTSGVRACAGLSRRLESHSTSLRSRP